MFNFPLGVLKRGLDFPGGINNEVFLFSVISKKEKIKSKPCRTFGSSSTLMSLVLQSVFILKQTASCVDGDVKKKITTCPNPVNPLFCSF